jgi:hypothetical protein
LCFVGLLSETGCYDAKEESLKEKAAKRMKAQYETKEAIRKKIEEEVNQHSKSPSWLRDSIRNDTIRHKVIPIHSVPL